MPAKRVIDRELWQRMCDMRKAGMPINKISAECHVCSRIVAECVADVACAKPAPGRATPITAEMIEEMRQEYARGVSHYDISRKYRISIARLRGLLAGRITPNHEEAVIPEFARVERVYSGHVALDESAFKAAGVPNTPSNREACTGRSRAWMRLYALRCLNPGYLDYGDAVDAVSAR